MQPSSTAALSSIPEVRGSAFLGLLSFIRETEGPDALQRVIERAGGATAGVFDDRIRKLGWYPYDAYASFLEAADQELGSGDLAYCVKLGAEAGRRDLGTIFAFFMRLYDPERLIKSCTRVWSQYHRDAGRMVAVRWERECTVLRIIDFDAMHPAHCRLMEGWMWQALSMIGGEVLSGSETECCSRGGTCHEFTCRWQQARAGAG